MEYEFKGIEETHLQTENNLRIEKEKINNDLERLKETHEQLVIDSQTFHSSEKITEETPSGDMDGPFSSVELVNISPQIKEKIIRLYHENKLLKSKNTDFNEEQLNLIQTQYDDEKQRSSDLQAKLNETSKLKIEFECQLNDLKKKADEKKTTSNIVNNSDQQSVTAKENIIDELKSKLSQMQEKHDKDTKNSEMATQILHNQLEGLTIEKNELKIENEKQCQKKDKELEESQEKMKSYLEKARLVIKSLDPSKNSAACVTEIQNLKTHLADKDKIITQLKKENEKMRNSQEQEENLMVSAWYNQGITMNRRATDERIATIGNSFLSQQRHLPSVLTGSPVLHNSSKKHANTKISPTHGYKVKNANDSID